MKGENMLMDDNRLMTLISHGDRQAFASLVDLYQTRVIHIAYGMLFDYEDACDASQEVFVKIYRSADTFRSESTLSTWIYRITKNVCIDFLRKRKEATLSLDDNQDDAPKIEIEDRKFSPEENAETHEIQQLVHDAISQLDDNSRLIITMFDIDGLSYDEISSILEIPAGTVKSRLNRARSKLRKILSEKRELFL